ncbi:MAG: hypothetical protein M3P70_11810 [Actinomycetota bacterium]|nr:hypothetical protein [Actinomycetota bacterium]
MGETLVQASAEHVERALLWTLQEDGGFAAELADELADDEVAVERVVTFADDGVLTDNRGLVLRLSDGSEFQLTIVRSR